MSDMLLKILENDLLSEDTKAEISEAFRKILAESKAQQEALLREEFVKRYESDRANIAEAVDQYINAKMESEIVEFHADVKSLNEQRMKYVNAQAVLKEQAQVAIKNRLAIFEKAIAKAFIKETKELHHDLKINRNAAIRTMTEVKAQAESDRQAFRTKAAKVLEHIINVKLQGQLNEMKTDIQKARENDFGARIYETFIAEARVMFFNSHKELRNLMKQITEQAATHKKEKEILIRKVNESQQLAKKAVGENQMIKESITRERQMNKILATIPSGVSRQKMKTLLESSATADLEKTFKKYASSVLTESKIVNKPTINTMLDEGSVGVRSGNGTIAQVPEVDDEEIVNIRHLAGIKRR